MYTVIFILLNSSAFVYFAFSNIQSNYYSLNNNNIKSSFIIRDIQKSMNYISRLTREVMLGADFKKGSVDVNG